METPIITEDYVPFYIAELLAEKGFDIPLKTAYNAEAKEIATNEALIFFMLSAKVREAQRAYYAASKGETKQKLLIRSKVLEKLLDEEIKKRIDTATKEEIQEMQIEWGNFVLCRQIDNIYI